MTGIAQGRLRISVIGAAFISAFLAGLVGALVIISAYGIGLARAGPDGGPLAMLAFWSIATGPVSTLPVGSILGAGVAWYVRRGLLDGLPEHATRSRASWVGVVLGGLYGRAFHYLFPMGMPFWLLLIAGLTAGLVAGRTAAAIVISDFRADRAA